MICKVEDYFNFEKVNGLPPCTVRIGLAREVDEVLLGVPPDTNL